MWRPCGAPVPPPACVRQVKASLRKLVKDVQDVETKKKHHKETSGVMSRAVAAAFEKAAQVRAAVPYLPCPVDCAARALL